MNYVCVMVSLLFDAGTRQSASMLEESKTIVLSICFTCASVLVLRLTQLLVKYSILTERGYNSITE